MLQNIPNCIIPKNFRGTMPPNPPSKRMATPRVASTPPPPQKKNGWPPLANPAYAHELLLKNLVENHYKIFLEGKKRLKSSHNIS